MHRIKILFLIESLSGGGAERVLATLVSNLDNSEFDITVCPIVGKGVYSDVIAKHSKLIPIIKDSNTLWGRIKYKFIYNVFPAKLVYFLFVPKNNDVEVAFVEGLSTKIISSSSNHFARKLAWVHTDLLNNHWTDIVYNSHVEEECVYSKFHRIICVSHSVKQAMKNVFSSLNSLTVLYNPVDPEEIKQLSYSVIDNNRFLRGKITLISIGRLVPQKGYDRLLPILKHLHDEGFEFVVNILGEGPERPILEKMIFELEMYDFVSLIGFMPNPYPYIRASDLFVCSSRCEGFSTSVNESLLLGLPIITTNCSGMNELIGNSGAGLIVNNDDESLYIGLKSILSDRSSLLSLSAAASRCFKDLSLKSYIQPIRDLLNEKESSLSYKCT